VQKGVKEITLLGQNVNAYGKDLKQATSFVGLLEKLDKIPGLDGIRFTTSHPRDFGEDLAECMARLKTVREHVHLPLQSGSDRILQAMGRGYTRAEYLEKIELLRRHVPGVAITADIIVGFPGETEEDFKQTTSALEEIRFDQIFSFKFSRRPSTRAAAMPDQVPEETKVARLERVHEIQDKITLEHYRASMGTVEEVLVEGVRPGSGQPYGRTRTNRIVNLDPSDRVTPGETVKVRIIKALKHSLLGKILP
jgi:tRNA-2-methylthio-N6-dimethylallyladenosine synthase